MSTRRILTGVALAVLACGIFLSACKKPVRVPLPDPIESIRKEQEAAPPTHDQLDPNIGRVFDVPKQAWLCKRNTDIFLTNRVRTEQDQSFFDSRIAQQLIIDLPPGTKLKRRPGPAMKFKNRLYLRLVVMGGDYDGHRGRVALDSIRKISDTAPVR